MPNVEDGGLATDTRVEKIVTRLARLTELYSEEFRAREWSEQRLRAYQVFRRYLLRFWIWVKSHLRQGDAAYADVASMVRRLLRIQRMVAGEIEPAPKPVRAMIAVTQNAAEANFEAMGFKMPEKWVMC